MTREEIINEIKPILEELSGYEDAVSYLTQNDRGWLRETIKILEQEPCTDCISREAVVSHICESKDCYVKDCKGKLYKRCWDIEWIYDLPPVTPQPKTGHCKDCKHFEYDRVAIVDGVPLMVAHEICSKWGDGCKTWENGYCFLFEPKESEEV